jgi:hypothetical protein
MHQLSNPKSSAMHPQHVEELKSSDLENVVGGVNNARVGGALVSGCCYQNSPGGEIKPMDMFFYFNYY